VGDFAYVEVPNFVDVALFRFLDENVPQF
jgi:hypothetical protein